MARLSPRTGARPRIQCDPTFFDYDSAFRPDPPLPPLEPPEPTTPHEADYIAALTTPTPEQSSADFIVDPSTGVIRQAGTVSGLDHTPSTNSLALFRASFERSLYKFIKVALGRSYLVAHLHGVLCKWLTHVPPYRKLLLWPREHCKSTIVSQGLPLHAFIQPREALDGSPNPYFEGIEGRDMCIVLQTFSDEMARKQMHSVKIDCESREILFALWPHVFYRDPRAESPRWSVHMIDVKRTVDRNDPSLWAVGLRKGTAGAHPHMIINDDIIEKREAASHIEMDYSRAHFKNSRSLINHPRALEYTVGTRWAIGDLYDDLLKDPTVESWVRSIVEPTPETGELALIYPEFFTWSKVEELKRDPERFALQYMNNASDSYISDFASEEIRSFTLSSSPPTITYHALSSDLPREARFSSPRPPPIPRGIPFKTAARLAARGRLRLS